MFLDVLGSKALPLAPGKCDFGRFRRRRDYYIPSAKLRMKVILQVTMFKIAVARTIIFTRSCQYELGLISGRKLPVGGRPHESIGRANKQE